MNDFIKKDNNTVTKFTFYSSDVLPEGIPISTPLTFPFVGQNLLIVKKDNNWWDILGGKLEKGENYIDALKRESLEEGGVEVDDFILIGYILAESLSNEKNNQYPPRTVLPVTISFVKKIYKNFKPNHEVKDRDMIKKSELKNYFSSREDNGQLEGIALIAFNFIKSDIFQYSFEFLTQNFEQYEGLPITQANIFVRNLATGKFIVVREFGETTFFLPGGGCRIHESGEECANRELIEETGIENAFLKLIGIISVKMFKEDKKVLSQFLQMRYLTSVPKFSNFTKNGFGNDGEIEEIIELDLEDMLSTVEHLKNPNGKMIINAVKSNL